ncbi:hypothetical protein H6F90_03695 [Trichocoleus sp. FACHB-591]|uniref:hypothetical protein n=1 Tax=Trichocoleus sp. FACHB-591 TaxID=2692872 RepID=UPI001687545F|nr:hypothetical protein [Trichocoleus sp. FACHB-591]MBD2094250.1 hypothetical protein [Trichocoleus sp. FACHB-591]
MSLFTRDSLGFKNQSSGVLRGGGVRGKAGQRAIARLFRLSRQSPGEGKGRLKSELAWKRAPGQGRGRWSQELGRRHHPKDMG